MTLFPRGSLPVWKRARTCERPRCSCSPFQNSPIFPAYKAKQQLLTSPSIIINLKIKAPCRSKSTIEIYLCKFLYTCTEQIKHTHAPCICDSGHCKGLTTPVLSKALEEDGQAPCAAASTTWDRLKATKCWLLQGSQHT